MVEHIESQEAALEVEHNAGAQAENDQINDRADDTEYSAANYQTEKRQDSDRSAGEAVVTTQHQAQLKASLAKGGKNSNQKRQQQSRTNQSKSFLSPIAEDMVVDKDLRGAMMMPDQNDQEA